MPFCYSWLQPLLIYLIRLVEIYSQKRQPLFAFKFIHNFNKEFLQINPVVTERIIQPVYIFFPFLADAGLATCTFFSGGNFLAFRFLAIVLAKSVLET